MQNSNNPDNVLGLTSDRIKSIMHAIEDSHTVENFIDVANSLAGLTRGHQTMIYQYAGLHIAGKNFTAIEVKELEHIFKSNMVQ